jgi:hypothetical protein
MSGPFSFSTNPDQHGERTCLKTAATKATTATNTTPMTPIAVNFEHADVRECITTRNNLSH